MYGNGLKNSTTCRMIQYHFSMLILKKIYFIAYN